MSVSIKAIFASVILVQVVLLACYIIGQVRLGNEKANKEKIQENDVFPNENQIKLDRLQDLHTCNEPKDIAVNHDRESSSNISNLKTGINTTKVRSNCGEIIYPISLAKGDTWYAVDEAKSTYVYSAYFEERSPTTTTITIIGAITRKQKYVCQLWYTSAEITVILKEVLAIMHDYGEGDNKRYTTCKFICTLPNKDIPKTVSIVTKSCTSPINLMPVITIKNRPFKRNFTVCLQPLHFRYGRAYELVEWIEVNRILGAEKFIIYNYSSATNVDKVLEEYTAQGIVEVVQWPIPMNVHQYPPTKANVEILAFGQVAAVNDCLYRIRETSKYLVHVDVDEFIIPHSPKNVSWNDMMQGLPRQGAYYFSNVFFRKDWSSYDTMFSRKHIAEQYRLVTLLKTEKEGHIWKPPKRSKYIVQTDLIENLGIHHVSKMATKAYIVPPYVALLHHYRNRQSYNDTQPRIKDETLLVKYKHAVVDNVSKFWFKLKNVELDIPNPDVSNITFL